MTGWAKPGTVVAFRTRIVYHFLFDKVIYVVDPFPSRPYGLIFTYVTVVGYANTGRK